MNALGLYYNGEYFKVMVDEETYSELINDQTKLSAYAKEVYNIINDKTPTNIAANNNLAVPSTRITETTDDETYSELINEPNNINLQGSSTEKILLKENFKWTQSLTLMLIDLRLNKEKEFNRPICKKKKLWEQIAAQIRNKTGIPVTTDMCDIEYRNLLSTYKTNKKKSQQSGEGCISWEYYQKFDEELGCKASILPHRDVLGDVDSVSEAPTVSETNSNSVILSTINQQDITESDTEEERGSQSEFQFKKKGAKDKNKKRKQSIDIGEYLFNKQLEDKKNRLEKEKKEDERWKEKRALKEREIEAIEKLAEAISKQNTKKY